MAKKQKRGKQPVQAKKKTTEQGVRKSLQTLQQSGQSPLILVGSSGSRILEGSIKGNSLVKNETTKEKVLSAIIQEKNVLYDLEQKENLSSILPKKLQQKVISSCNSYEPSTKSTTSEKQTSKDDTASYVERTLNLGENLITSTSVSEDQRASSSSSDATNCSSSSGVQDVFELTDDKDSAEYWKAYAEEIRVTLLEALKENESLHDQVEVLETDNKRLLDIVNQAKQLSTLLKDSIEFDLEENSD